jgi:hypothetical protein
MKGAQDYGRPGGLQKYRHRLPHGVNGCFNGWLDATPHSRSRRCFNRRFSAYFNRCFNRCLGGASMSRSFSTQPALPATRL